MNLFELVHSFPTRPADSVPEWMLGYFRRHAISFCDGTTDLDTRVSWMQSRNFTIDLRLPTPTEAAPEKPLAQYSREELNILSEYEGWQADSEWNGQALSWHSANSLQLHNRWPEPAILQRIGNCMIEFAPSGAYVEDWRLQHCGQGPLIGLKLINEQDEQTHEIFHRGGGLIICGQYAGLVLGRPEVMSTLDGANGLRKLVMDSGISLDEILPLFQFETSIAKGGMDLGYTVMESTAPWRIGQPLMSLEGFSLASDQRTVIQQIEVDGAVRIRRFIVDTLEPEFHFATSTSCTEAARDWLQQEAQTLGRYTRIVE